MSKEDWFGCYERALDRGLSEREAIKAAEEGAADIAAQRIDEAWKRAREER